MRFDGFQSLLRYRADTAPEATAVIRELSGRPEKVSNRAFLDDVMSKANRLKVGRRTCLGILCDGTYECLLNIFASNIAGLQTVLLDEKVPESLIPELIKYTDMDMFWDGGNLDEDYSRYLTAGVKDGKGKILFFTSGTTERAKAVVLTDASLCSSAWNGSEMLPLSESDLLLCILPLNHVFGFVCGVLWALHCGAAVALGRGARHYIDDCKFFRPTAVSAVPALLGFMLKNNCLNPEMKLVLVGAGECHRQVLDAVTAKGIRVAFGYGLTETSSGVAISTSGDPYAMEVCPDDRIRIAGDGEITVRAPTCMMQGYYKLPGDTRNALKNGTLYTGDMGFFDSDGKLHISGRKKEMLVLPDGTKIFLPEYEWQITAATGENDIAVVMKDGRPVLVIHADPSKKDEIAEKLKPVMDERPRGQQIAEYIFTDKPLPRTRTGKIQRWEVQKEAGK